MALVSASNDGRAIDKLIQIFSTSQVFVTALISMEGCCRGSRP